MADVYEIITERFIKALESGYIPWKQPWSGVAAHHNYVSRKAYNGGNVFMLMISQMFGGFSSNAWLTYKQAVALGGTVKKGSKATQVYFWKVSRYKAKDAKPDDPIKKSFMLRYYNVFNLDQIEGIEPRVTSDSDIVEIPKPRDVWKSWQQAPPVRHVGAAAYYEPAADRITMPPLKTFKTAEAYYATLFHEGVHATGHESRLDRRKGAEARHTQGAYAREELVAEIGAAFLCAECGIDTPELEENSKAYIQNWIKSLKNDPKLILNASSAAQKAANYMLGRVATYSDAEEVTQDDGAEVASEELAVAA